MTGRHPVRYGLQYSVILPGQPWGLPLNEKVGRGPTLLLLLLLLSLWLLWLLLLLLLLLLFLI